MDKLLMKELTKTEMGEKRSRSATFIYMDAEDYEEAINLVGRGVSSENFERIREAALEYIGVVPVWFPLDIQERMEWIEHKRNPDLSDEEIEDFAYDLQANGWSAEDVEVDENFEVEYGKNFERLLAALKAAEEEEES